MTKEDQIYGDTANIFGSDLDPLPEGIADDLKREFDASRASHGLPPVKETER